VVYSDIATHSNKTFLPASDPGGIRWSRPLYLWIDQPFSFHSKFKTPKLKIAIINTRQTYNTRHKHLRYSLRDCHNNPPHQLVSSYMQVVTCTMGITLNYVFLVKHASGHKTREQLQYVSKVQTLFMLNYCCCSKVMKSSPPLSHYY